VLRTSKATEKLHVLVVEDNLVNQKVLAKQLRNLGCVVSVANHGGEALDFLRTTSSWRDENKTQDTKPQKDETQINGNGLPIELSLILMDWEMPVMNGLTAVTKIREFEHAGRLTGYIPIIGVTANVRQQQVQMAMDVGMDDVVSKPFRVPELMSRMRDIVDDLEKGDRRRRGMSLDTLKEGEG
jgi:CheY-like chemotaxis protein